MISENAQKLLEKRYFIRDLSGNLVEKTWEDLVERVVNNITQAEDDYSRPLWSNLFKESMCNLDFIPSSPCLFNSGMPSQQLSSCFILDVEDSIEDIFSTVAECAKIFQMSGGAGFSMKKIRPKGDLCKSSGSDASGVVSFMHVFNTVVERVKQGNKRNGALLITLPISHPEILDFIMCKDDLKDLNNMNISISLSHDFIEAVKNDLEWDLEFKGQVYETVKARDLWDRLLTQARKNGEPGVCFQTTMDLANMNPHISKDVNGNPCHEFTNIPYSSCNLASVNMSNMIVDDNIDYSKLASTLQLCMRFLDNMISVNRLPLKKIQEITELIRPMGLGTMGLAHMLYKLRIPYGSEKALKVIGELYEFIQTVTDTYNQELAEERGEYPAWKGSKWEEIGKKVRCSSTTSIAPNGSIAIIANTTGGIEPQFALVYTRHMNEGDVLYVVDPVFEEYLKEVGKHNKTLLGLIAKNNGSIKGLDEYFTQEEQDVFTTAGDISPEWHVKILARIQKYTSLAISKTVNLPKTATKKDVGEVFLMAEESGIKGITVYVDGSRDSQVLVTSSTFDVKNDKYTEVKPRPTIADGYTVKLKSGCCDMNATLNFDNSELLEVRVNNSNGGCSAMYQGLGMMASEALRLGGDPDRIAEQLNQVTCPANMKKSGCHGKSCPDALGRLIKHAVKGKQDVIDFVKNETPKREYAQNFAPTENKGMTKCKECGELSYVNESACGICRACGYSACK